MLDSASRSSATASRSSARSSATASCSSATASCSSATASRSSATASRSSATASRSSATASRSSATATRTPSRSPSSSRKSSFSPRKSSRCRRSRTRWQSRLRPCVPRPTCLCPARSEGRGQSSGPRVPLCCAIPRFVSPPFRETKHLLRRAVHLANTNGLLFRSPVSSVHKGALLGARSLGGLSPTAAVARAPGHWLAPRVGSRMAPGACLRRPRAR
eukprot:scaffold34378_cov65-Phaeocystis_antarctica.AAC.2